MAYRLSDTDLADLRAEFAPPRRTTCRVCGVTGDHTFDCAEADETADADDDDTTPDEDA